MVADEFDEPRDVTAAGLAVGLEADAALQSPRQVVLPEILPAKFNKKLKPTTTQVPTLALLRASPARLKKQPALSRNKMNKQNGSECRPGSKGNQP